MLKCRIRSPPNLGRDGPILLKLFKERQFYTTNPTRIIKTVINRRPNGRKSQKVLSSRMRQKLRKNGLILSENTADRKRNLPVGLKLMLNNGNIMICYHF